MLYRLCRKLGLKIEELCQKSVTSRRNATFSPVLTQAVHCKLEETIEACPVQDISTYIKSIVYAYDSSLDRLDILA